MKMTRFVVIYGHVWLHQYGINLELDLLEQEQSGIEPWTCLSTSSVLLMLVYGSGLHDRVLSQHYVLGIQTWDWYHTVMVSYYMYIVPMSHHLP